MFRYPFSSFFFALNKNGKLHLADKLFFRLLFFAVLKHSDFGPHFLSSALRHVRPLIELDSSRLGRPKPISSRRSFFLAIRWLVQGAFQRPERSFSLRLFREILDARDLKGFAIKKKFEWHSRALKK